MTDKTNSYLAAGKCAITALQPQICAFSSARVPLPHLGNSNFSCNFFRNGCGVSNCNIHLFKDPFHSMATANLKKSEELVDLKFLKI